MDKPKPFWSYNKHSPFNSHILREKWFSEEREKLRNIEEEEYKDYLRRITQKPSLFLEWEIDRKELYDYSFAELTEIIMMCQSVIREKNKIIEELKKQLNHNNI